MSVKMRADSVQTCNEEMESVSGLLTHPVRPSEAMSKDAVARRVFMSQS